ncbi:LysR family transcriptional regulator [Pectobacteriaceae bacterium CE70]|uniref:LysR family transcriptional regulator n=1 Tax=Brenneria uluponensis TaxID=3057057 RepID=UPI0028EC12DC|nr:LysR family transcriptional regulator [Brenneria ulupoensis]WJV64033.1 LysR family transcriptional regulator [Pectobacteriaceae bacterium C52]WJV68446.1 LysR family transcriptional regulator [Pectobacteriaceae bacterium CE70]WJY12375.1 LysR family transcriptional regulator [Pectobacteriaceae bacterium C80]
MKIQLLREFLMLSEWLNFTKSAQKLHITQPVLSRHMKELEAYFDVELFRRDTHKVELTGAGQLLSAEVRKITQQYDDSMSVMRTFTGQSRRHLSIVFLGEAISQLLIDLVDSFRCQYLDVVVDCRDSELDEALVLLDMGKSDLGFLIRPNFIPQRANFCSLPFQTDPLCVAVNRHHPLANRQRVSLKEIVNWPIIRVDPREFALSELYSTHFLSSRDIQFTLYKEYPNLKTCCFDLEMNRHAVLLMPKHRGYLLGNNSVLLEVDDQDCEFILELVWDRHNSNPCVNLFTRKFKVFLDREGELLTA